MKNLLPLILIIFIAACSAPRKAAIVEEIPNYFAGTKGCFLLYNLRTGQYEKVIGDDACKEQLPACSSFKVPLAVMAFDSLVLKDENQSLKWDGTKRMLDAWNQDHNAMTWMKESVVWFSQKLTPKMGKKKFQKYLNSFDYGNKDISAGLTDAWLKSPSEVSALKISAYEQVEFMKKLWTDTLPASKRAMKLTREITYLEQSPKGYKLSGKTGSNFYDEAKKVQLGWFISHVGNEDSDYIAVTTISDLKPIETKYFGGFRAKEITKEILKAEGLW